MKLGTGLLLAGGMLEPAPNELEDGVFPMPGKAEVAGAVVTAVADAVVF